jgi:leucyl-tRNA synthetase
MINCEQCGTVPVPEDELPVVLPRDVNFAVSGSPLAQCPEFMNTICPKCGQDATRESDTFDTFMESSWYYARFACQDQDNAMLDDRAKYWTPVDQYVGGVEHAVMHLLYARFFHKLMRDEGLVNSDEPFKRLLTQGMLLKNGHKMSKSVGNVVDPNQLIDQYGADTARLFVLFAAPPEQSLEWSDAGVEGAHRFLKRLWLFVHQHQALMLEMNDIFGEELPKVECHANNTKLKKSRLTTNQILAQANHDYERQQFNTVISAAMKLLNELSSFTIEMDEDRYFIYTGISVLLRILAPITPHITHVLWQHCGFSLPIIDAHWPKVDKHALKSNDVDFIVQVNGKMRGQFSASTDMPENDLIERACLEVSTFLVDKTIAKTIIVPHRQLINLVVNA